MKSQKVFKNYTTHSAVLIYNSSPESKHNLTMMRFFFLVCPRDSNRVEQKKEGHNPLERVETTEISTAKWVILKFSIQFYLPYLHTHYLFPFCNSLLYSTLGLDDYTVTVLIL